MLDSRKTAILCALVEEYIHSAQPVGSKRIVDSPGVDVSSATIRNEMVALEMERYVTQPYTSAGRVPTAKAYRFFVDCLHKRSLPLNPALHPDGHRQVANFFSSIQSEASSVRETSSVFSSTVRLLSDITDHMGVAVVPSFSAAIVKFAQIIEIATGKVLVLAVMSDGVVEKRIINVPSDTTSDIISDASRRLAERVLERTLAEIEEFGEAGTCNVEVDVEVDPILTAALNALKEATAQHEVFVGGASKLADAFDEDGQLREVLRLIEHQIEMVTLIRDIVSRGSFVSHGSQVAIGVETGFPELAGCALVLTPYTAGDADCGVERGVVGILGPARMDYLQVLAAVTIVGEHLSATLSEHERKGDELEG